MEGYRNTAGDRIFFDERDYRRDGEFCRSEIHFHRQVEIFRLLEGSVVCSVNTDAFHVESGGILVIPPRMPHSSVYSDPKNSRMVINCDMSLLSPELEAAVDVPFGIEPRPEQKQEIDALFRKIQKEYHSGDKHAEAALLSSISLLLILLLRAKPDRKTICVQDDFVEKAISYIHRNYAGRIRITEAARFCGVSAGHLSRTFKEKTNLPFNEFVLIYRLRQAEIRLLDYPSKSISEIAYSCGFNDSNYFSGCFKKQYGITPTQFRSGYRGAGSY